MNKHSKRPERVRGKAKRKIFGEEGRQRFLIVCEGEKTEPKYFKGFQVPGLVIFPKPVKKRGVALIQEAKEIYEEGDYDQVWCVFDRDDLSMAQLKAAFALAEHEKIQIAFSNEAFEIWFLLHFDYHQSAMSRSDYYELLSRKLGCKYEKNAEDMYDKLIILQGNAIKNAKKLMMMHGEEFLIRPVPSSPNPSTTVYKLVEELNKYKRP